MNKISIPTPFDLSDISIVEDSISGYYDLIRSNIKEIIELTQLRDTLLPKLISGELEVNHTKN